MKFYNEIDVIRQIERGFLEVFLVIWYWAFKYKIKIFVNLKGNISIKSSCRIIKYKISL